MNPATLDDHHSRLLGALTIATSQRLCGDTIMIEDNNRMRALRLARVGDIVLLDHPGAASTVI